ncbi:MULTISPECIES: response regulator [Streptacidiphilus]|uniref:Response regulator n=1 Tax=Streptacidiphilus cavernicola TaxID=3342716 RepID=A0ABV6UQU9_9ACTN|nr:response regulator [Streptacidiphilus jeojiense]
MTPAALPAARRCDILLVEDDAADAMLIEEALLGHGLARNLHKAVDGVAALEHLRTPGVDRPDLIVMDLNMPRMNGLELLAVLKADEQLKVIPVVVLTTSSAPQDIAGAYRSHANAFITKPVTLDEFAQAVRSIDAFFLDTATRVPRDWEQG